MTDQTAGYSFIIEFNETAINKVVRALFEVPDAGVQTNFRHDEPGQPGLISSRETETGRISFQRYLFEGLLGYEVDLYDPFVELYFDQEQQIALNLSFDLSLIRQVLIKKTDDPLNIPDDPSTVDPDADYETVYDTGLYPKEPPSARGRLKIVLGIGELPFGPGNRVSIDAQQSELDLVKDVVIQGIDWDEGFGSFVEKFAAKSISTLLREEIREIDITPLFGVFDVFSISLREPIQLRMSETAQSPALSVGLHEWSLVDNGEPERISFETSEYDYCLQVSESFLSLLMNQLFNGEIIPRRYDLDGSANPEGDLLLHNPRISLENGSIRIHLLIDYDGKVGLFAKTSVRLKLEEAGKIEVSLADTSVHVQLSGLLGAIQVIFNTFTFHILDRLVGEILGALLEAVVVRPIGKTLDEFLAESALGFALRSPLRDTDLFASIEPTKLGIEPGRLLLCGVMGIEETNADD